MRLLASLMLLVCFGSVAFGQEMPVPPPPTALPSQPFFIKNTWIIGGVGSSDYLTMDASTRELFIAHGPTVQVVDVDSGTVAGIVGGFREAHAIVLDADRARAYVTDGQADLVRIFDRHSFRVLANIPTGPAPRSMALDASTGLLFVVGGQAMSIGSESQRETSGRAVRVPGRQATGGKPHGPQSTITVIDTEHRLAIAELTYPGDLGFAQTDNDGHVFVAVRDRNQIIRLDTHAVENALRVILRTPAATAPAVNQSRAKTISMVPVLNWYAGTSTSPPADALPYAFNLGSGCNEPRALAIDTNHSRLFVACSNFRMIVIDPQRGDTISALPIGPGPDAIGYDSNRGLIFTANGGGDGSVTIIRQDVTDTYSVIQTLPTRQRARTLAIDSASGNVYLTSILTGAAMTTPMTNGKPAAMKVSPIDSSFQVLVVGN